MRARSLQILLSSLCLLGCASQNPDTMSDVLGPVERVASAMFSPITDQVDEIRRNRWESGRGDQLADSKWELCSRNPCLYADRCIQWFPDRWHIPNCPVIQGTSSGAGESISPLSRPTIDLEPAYEYCFQRLSNENLVECMEDFLDDK